MMKNIFPYYSFSYWVETNRNRTVTSTTRRQLFLLVYPQHIVVLRPGSPLRSGVVCRRSIEVFGCVTFYAISVSPCQLSSLLSVLWCQVLWPIAPHNIKIQSVIELVYSYQPTLKFNRWLNWCTASSPLCDHVQHYFNLGNRAIERWLSCDVGWCNRP